MTTQMLLFDTSTSLPDYCPRCARSVIDDDGREHGDLCALCQTDVEDRPLHGPPPPYDPDPLDFKPHPDWKWPPRDWGIGMAVCGGELGGHRWEVVMLEDKDSEVHRYRYASVVDGEQVATTGTYQNAKRLAVEEIRRRRRR